MRVAIDVTPLAGPRSGVGQFTAALLGALAAHEPGLEVAPFVVSGRALAARRPRSATAPDLPAGTRFVPLPARAAHRIWGAVRVPMWDRSLGRPAVVHATNFVAPPTRAPAVLSVHDLTFVHHPQWCRPEVRAMVPAVRRAIAAGAWVHTLTDAVAAEVRREFGTDRVVAVAPAGAPPGGAGPVSDRVAAVTAGPPFALVLGAAEVRKNVVAAIDAFTGPHRDGRGGEPLRLVIAGPPGPQSAAIDVRAAGHDGIVLLGYVTDTERSALLRAARVLVHPAIDEGFGLPVVEAMREGVPVVCTDTAVLREVAGEAAWFVDAAWQGAYATVEAAAFSPERDARIAAGRTRAAQFSWERTAHGLAALYTRAVDGSS